MLIVKNLNSFYSTLNKYQKSSPPDEDFFEKYLFKSPKLIDDSYYQLKRSSSNENKEENINKIIDELYIRSPVDIDNYPFYLSIENDNRNCFDIFIKILKEK